MKDSVHWANRLYRRRKRLCVDGKGGWRMRLTALEYFTCLVDGIPCSADPLEIMHAVDAYDDERLFGDVPWDVSLGEYPVLSLRDWIWEHSKQLVPRCVAYAIPERFPWQILGNYWRSNRFVSVVVSDEIWDEDIPF